MESTNNPLYITNSELAQVEAFRNEIINIFRAEYNTISVK